MMQYKKNQINMESINQEIKFFYKLSFFDFQKYLDSNYQHLHINFQRDLQSQIKKIITDTIISTYYKLDKKKKCNSF